MSNKRRSVLPAIDRSGPKPPVNFSSSLTISDNAILQGTHPITMGADTVIHPLSCFESTLGSVLVGRRCIIHERAHIGASTEDRDRTNPGGVTLGDYVLVEVGTTIEAGGTEIGEGSVIQVGSKIESGAKIGRVRIGPSYPSCNKVTDNMVVYSNGDRRLDRRGNPEFRKLGIVKQIATLRKMIPSNPDKFR